MGRFHESTLCGILEPGEPLETGRNFNFCLRPLSLATGAKFPSLFARAVPPLFVAGTTVRGFLASLVYMWTLVWFAWHVPCLFTRRWHVWVPSLVTSGARASLRLSVGSLVSCGLRFARRAACVLASLVSCGLRFGSLGTFLASLALRRTSVWPLSAPVGACGSPLWLGRIRWQTLQCTRIATNSFFDVVDFGLDHGPSCCCWIGGTMSPTCPWRAVVPAGRLWPASRGLWVGPSARAAFWVGPPPRAAFLMTSHVRPIRRRPLSTPLVSLTSSAAAPCDDRLTD